MPRTAPTPAPQADPPPPPKPTASSAHLFRAERTEGHVYLLPGSALLARIRRVSPMALIAHGVATNSISEDVIRLLALRTETTDDKARIEQFTRNTKAFLQVAALALVEPCLVLDREPNYDDNEIGPQDIGDVDLMFIWSTVTEGYAAEAIPFRVVP